MKYFKLYFSEVSEIEVDKETDKSVFINGRKHAKETSYEAYFKTRDEAIKFKLDKLNAEITRRKNAVAYVEEELATFKQKMGFNERMEIIS